MAFFKVATEGNTADGRYIKREWISDIANNYNAKKYTARIFVEHLRGMSPDSAFRCGGDVLAVKSEEIDGKLCLFADLGANDYLKTLNAADQKVFSSIEVEENFAGTGQAYLTGLGVTDSPASLGLDKLKFSTQSAFAKGISGSKDVYLGEEIDLSVFSVKPDDNKTSLADQIAQGFTSALAQLFKKTDKAEPTEPATVKPETAFSMADLDVVAAKFSQSIEAVVQKHTKDFAKASELAEVVERLDIALKTPADNYSERTLTPGGVSIETEKANF